MKILYKEKEMEHIQTIKISELLKEEIQTSQYTVVGAKFNNEYQNLDFEINKDGKVELIDISQKEGMNLSDGYIIIDEENPYIDVPDDVVVAGNPAKIIKSVD